MKAKPHLKVVQGQPVEVTGRLFLPSSSPNRETPIAAARRRAGGTFGWERTDFKWTQGATVLTAEWLAEQAAKRRK